MNPVHFSSSSDQWSTPRAFVEPVIQRFGLTLDVCADASNAVVQRYFTKEQDGLAQSWAGERVWCNPPYKRGVIGKWIRKCATAGTEGGPALAVLLVPARTDTSWWHDHIVPTGRITFIRGRLTFGAAKNRAPFPSALIVFGDP